MHKMYNLPRVAHFSDRLKIEKRNDNSWKVFWGEREVGTIYVIGHEWIYKSPRGPEHFCIKYQGYGFQETLVRALQQLDIDTIMIDYTGKERDGKKRKIIYEMPLEDFVRAATPDCLRIEDGCQLFLAEEDWKIANPKATTKPK